MRAGGSPWQQRYTFVILAFIKKSLGAFEFWCLLLAAKWGIAPSLTRSSVRGISSFRAHVASQRADAAVSAGNPISGGFCASCSARVEGGAERAPLCHIRLRRAAARRRPLLTLRIPIMPQEASRVFQPSVFSVVSPVVRLRRHQRGPAER